MSGITNPHDKFFKENFSQPEITKDFLTHYLPPDVRNLLNLDQITIQKDSFIDSDFQEHFSDLLFLIPMKDGGDAYIYTLFEHKSYPDSWVALQLLRYMVKIWERDVKEEDGDLLLPIIPIVVYHGEEEWNISTQFIDRFLPDKILQRFSPKFEYLIYDIPRLQNDEIAGTNKLRLILWLLKYILTKDFLLHLKEDVPLFALLKQEMISEDFQQTVLLYIFRNTDHAWNKEVEKEIISQLQMKDGDNTMITIADKLIEEGMQKGLEKGWQSGLSAGKQQDIQKIIKIRFGRLPVETQQNLEKIDDHGKLDDLLTAAVTANSLSDFIQILR